MCLNWGQVHARWARIRWSRIFFTDESRFNLQGADENKVFGAEKGNEGIQLTSLNVIVLAAMALWCGVANI